MRQIFRVHKDAQTIRLANDIVAEGFDGELEGFIGAVTLTLLKPGTSLTLAIESLQGTISELQLRIKARLEVIPKPLKGTDGLDELKRRIGK